MYASGHNVPMMPGMAGPPMMGYPGYHAMPRPGSYGSMVRLPPPPPLPPLLRLHLRNSRAYQVCGTCQPAPFPAVAVESWVSSGTCHMCQRAGRSSCTAT